MGWLKLDDNVSHHRKMLAAGDVACWLWVCGLAYCQRHNTDGRITKAAVPFLGCAGWKAAILRLLAVALWVDEGDVYRVHDYLAWNDSAEERRRKSDDRNARVTRYRERQQRDSNTAPHPTPHPTPTPQPVPSPDGDGRAPRAEVAARASALGLVPPATWERQHATHALRGDLCGWVCLPASLHAEWVNRLLGAGATRETAVADILAWALDVRARWTASAHVPGDDNFAFWRHEWAATHGSNRPPVATSRAQLDPAAGVREALRRG